MLFALYLVLLCVDVTPLPSFGTVMCCCSAAASVGTMNRFWGNGVEKCVVVEGVESSGRGVLCSVVGVPLPSSTPKSLSLGSVESIPVFSSSVSVGFTNIGTVCVLGRSLASRIDF